MGFLSQQPSGSVQHLSCTGMIVHHIGQPRHRFDGGDKRGSAIREFSDRMEAHRRPYPSIFGIAAKVLETAGSVRSLEQIDTAIVLVVLDAGENQPGLVDALRHNETRDGNSDWLPFPKDMQ